MTAEPESLVLQLLRDMRAEMCEMRSDLKADIPSVRADGASDLSTAEQIVGLRHAVIEYHTTVIGHGTSIGELEARPRRVEQPLDLPSAP